MSEGPKGLAVLGCCALSVSQMDEDGGEGCVRKEDVKQPYKDVFGHAKVSKKRVFVAIDGKTRSYRERLLGSSSRYCGKSALHRLCRRSDLGVSHPSYASTMNKTLIKIWRTFQRFP